MPKSTDDPAFLRRQAELGRAGDIVTRFLATLPADQVGEEWFKDSTRTIVVQVTRDADQVRRELQARLGDLARVEVETVRYSKAELVAGSARIRAIPGLVWSGVGMSANGRLDVGVPGDVATARAMIEKVVDPCMVNVTQMPYISPASG